MSNKILGLIPARYGSTRFPGKPLALIHDKPMIQLVYEQAKKVLENVYVATDDERIFQAVQSFGGSVVMTSENHQSGTDRCSEARPEAERIDGRSYDVVINIQGDEPFIAPEQISMVAALFNSPRVQIGTLVKKISQWQDIEDPNKVKVVMNHEAEAIYFSRSPIPHVRGCQVQDWLSRADFFHHIGIYGYRSAVLDEITRLESSQLEKSESLEQLRWLENGYSIMTAQTTLSVAGIDTPEDLAKVVASGK
ncbi:MAG: 3-deoxy-manno-octulosonate cytidylyltransferase [Desulfobulbaceae bacterium]|nr:MAG: 3-deoxy-manno-octulosonate cytidylyltransferase [Desulfobulbaceae bacterium]